MTEDEIADLKQTREQRIETVIMRRVIKDALEAGYSLSVNDGEETTVHKSRDPEAVFAAMRTTDEDTLILSHASGHQAGWIAFVYGNDGWDVISDYTTRLEPLLAPINEFANTLDPR